MERAQPRKLSLALACLAFAGAAAGETLKPGLWEVTTQMKSGSGQMEAAMAQMQQQMAAMSPEQRRMMQEMMAKQGVSMGGGGPGAMSARLCLTQEMLARNEIPVQRGDCRTTQQSKSGNTLKMAFSCANPPSSGEAEISFAGAESYRSVVTVNTTAQGRSETMRMDGGGKWLSADCGGVKPLAAPR